MSNVISEDNIFPNREIWSIVLVAVVIKIYSDTLAFLLTKMVCTQGIAGKR